MVSHKTPMNHGGMQAGASVHSFSCVGGVHAGIRGAWGSCRTYSTDKSLAYHCGWIPIKNALRRHTFTIAHVFRVFFRPSSPSVDNWLQRPGYSSYGTQVIMYGIRSFLSAGAFLGLALVNVKAIDVSDKPPPPGSSEADCKLRCANYPKYQNVLFCVCLSPMLANEQPPLTPRPQL